MVTHPFFSYSVLHAEPLTRYSDAGCPFCLHELSVRSRVSKTHLNPSCLPGQSSHSLPLPLLVPRGPGRTWFSEYESVEYSVCNSIPSLFFAAKFIRPGAKKLVASFCTGDYFESWPLRTSTTR